MGEQKETLTRICHELPGYNWLEEKIRKSVTSDPPTPQTSSSTSTTTTSSLNVNDGTEGSGSSLPSKPTARILESNSSQE